VRDRLQHRQHARRPLGSPICVGVPPMSAGALPPEFILGPAALSLFSVFAQALRCCVSSHEYNRRCSLDIDRWSPTALPPESPPSPPPPPEPLPMTPPEPPSTPPPPSAPPPAPSIVARVSLTARRSESDGGRLVVLTVHKMAASCDAIEASALARTGARREQLPAPLTTTRHAAVGVRPYPSR
jgi:hypothetical protein